MPHLVIVGMHGACKKQETKQYIQHNLAEIKFPDYTDQGL